MIMKCSSIGRIGVLVWMAAKAWGSSSPMAAPTAVSRTRSTSRNNNDDGMDSNTLQSMGLSNDQIQHLLKEERMFEDIMNGSDGDLDNQHEENILEASSIQDISMDVDDLDNHDHTHHQTLPPARGSLNRRRHKRNKQNKKKKSVPLNDEEEDEDYKSNKEWWKDPLAAFQDIDEGIFDEPIDEGILDHEPTATKPTTLTSTIVDDVLPQQFQDDPESSEQYQDLDKDDNNKGTVLSDEQPSLDTSNQKRTPTRKKHGRFSSTAASQSRSKKRRKGQQPLPKSNQERLSFAKQLLSRRSSKYNNKSSGSGSGSGTDSFKAGAAGALLLQTLPKLRNVLVGLGGLTGLGRNITLGHPVFRIAGVAFVGRAMFLNWSIDRNSPQQEHELDDDHEDDTDSHLYPSDQKEQDDFTMEEEETQYYDQSSSSRGNNRREAAAANRRRKNRISTNRNRNIDSYNDNSHDDKLVPFSFRRFSFSNGGGQKALSKRKLEEEVLELQERADSAEHDRDSMEKEYEKASWQLQEMHADLQAQLSSSKYLTAQLRENEEVMDRAIRSERMRAKTELKRMKEAMMTVLERERHAMRDELRRQTTELEALLEDSQTDREHA